MYCIDSTISNSIFCTIVCWGLSVSLSFIFGCISRCIVRVGSAWITLETFLVGIYSSGSAQYLLMTLYLTFGRSPQTFRLLTPVSRSTYLGNAQKSPRQFRDRNWLFSCLRDMTTSPVLKIPLCSLVVMQVISHTMNFLGPTHFKRTTLFNGCSIISGKSLQDLRWYSRYYYGTLFT